MIGLSPSLLRAQRSSTILGKHLLIRCVLTYGATTYTYNLTKIKQLSYTRQPFSHKSELMLEDTDKTLHGLDLEGYKAVLSYGLITKAGEEWVDAPPLWVIGQQRDSYRDRLECSLSLEGIFDRMGRHKATASYTPASGDTRTVKDWLKEIIELTETDTETEEEQATGDSNLSLTTYADIDWQALHEYSLNDVVIPADSDRRYICTTAGTSGASEPSWTATVGGTTDDGEGETKVVWTCHHGSLYYGGQRLTISNRRVTKLAFKLKKVGSPSGPVTFYIDTVAGSHLAQKVWGDAFNLETTYDWAKVTLDTPLFLNEEVRIHCEFTGGDASNYVDFYYNASSVVASEYLTWLYDTGEWTDGSTYDAVYRYSYSATPVTVYDDYPAYGLVFDSEDTLIDSFIPADSFRINLNDTRLAKVKWLMSHTDCIALPKNDGLIHIIDPTTSGTTYDNEFTLVQGRDYHNFFNKRFRRRIVSPNYIVFKNHPSHDDVYTGYAKDDSADLDEGSGSGSMKEIETHYVRATGNTQCTALATAYLSKLQMAADKGSAVLPFVHFGQEVYDYVNFVDARAGDNRSGNVGFLTIFYKPSQFNMHIGFGRPPLGVPALQGLAAETGDRAGLRAENLLPLIDSLYSYVEQLLDIVGDKADIDSVNEILLALYEDACFRKATVTEEMNIPSEAA